MAVSLHISWEGRSAADFSRVYAAAASIDTFRPVLAAIGSEVIAPSVSQNFAAGGRPRWADLSEATIAAKRARGNANPTKVLVASGAMAKAAANSAGYKVTKDELRAAPFGIDYWVYHQSGTTNMPQRVIMMLQAADRTAIFAMFAAYMRGFMDLGSRQFTGGKMG